MELSQARAIAVAACTKIEPFTTRLHIAGSIRRKKPEVKDIELVVTPKYDITYKTDLFNNKTEVHGVSFGFVKAVESLGKIEKGTAYGRYMKIILPEGINLDLFIPDPEDFIRQYVVRTGSADYAHKVIAAAWRKKGWVGSNCGLRRVEDCIEHKQQDGKSKWECVRNKTNKPPNWPDEISFFNWLDLNFVKPEHRNI